MPKRTKSEHEGSVMQPGPRGGVTTMTGAGLVRKTCYFTQEEWEAIRLAAYQQNVAYSHVIQTAVRAALFPKSKKERSPR